MYTAIVSKENNERGKEQQQQQQNASSRTRRQLWTRAECVQGGRARTELKSYAWSSLGRMTTFFKSTYMS